MKRRVWYAAALLAGAAIGGGVRAAEEEAPSTVFTLGVMVVAGTADPAGEGTFAEVTGDEAERQFRRDVAEAAAMAPGVTLARVGGRNEQMAMVRGFDTRQVPLFIDGIPVYVPYDGNVDMGRFGVFDMAELSISKGYSPVIFGPNTLGGAVNLVSRRPSRPEELYLRGGVSSGEGFEGAARGGLLRPKGYAQAGVSWRQREYYRVSDDFKATATEDGGERENSDSRDVRVSAKLGWTPGLKGDELAVGFVRQDSEKGVPPYAGSDTNTLPRYWRYTEWIKNSIYVVGNQSIGQTGYVKPRIYYDTYENTLKAFDDDTYSTQTKRSSWTSVYDDYSFGGSVEAGAVLAERHALQAAVHYKQDVHREHNLGGLAATYKDETWSAGAEDRISLTDRLSLSAGLAVDGRRSLEAADAATGDAFAENDNTAVNPQAGLFYAVTGGVFRVTAAHKTRFPTLKDRYSYRLGTALPNPDLDPERALHLEAGYEGRLTDRLAGRAAVFYSRLDDTIQQVDDVAQDDEGAWLYQLRNTGESESAGVELGLAWQAGETMKAGINYLYLHRENIDNPEIKLTDAPAHSLKMRVEWQVHSRFRVIPAVVVNSSRYSSSDGTKVDGFWRCDVDAQVELPHGFGLYAGVHNLFDENYELGEGYPEEGRSFHAGGSWAF